MSKQSQCPNGLGVIVKRIAFFAWAIFFSNSAYAVPLVLLDRFETLHNVDTDALGVPSTIGTIGFGGDVIELVAASETELYTFDRDSNTLLIVSRSTAAILATAPLDRDLPINPRGFDVSPSGALYGVFGSQMAMQLHIINPATGVTTPVANLTGPNTIEAIAFGDDGTLYAAASPSGNVGDHLYTINIATGELALIGAMGLEIDTLAFAPDGFLYGAISGPGRRNLYRINPNTAVRQLVGDTGVDSILGIAPEARPMTVAIDVKPRSAVSPIAPRSRGVIPVAVLTTSVADGDAFDFDATQVDPGSVSFGPGGAVEAHSTGHLEDVDHDGDLDLLLHFRTQDSGIACSHTNVTLTGQTFVGSSITGSALIRTVGCR